MNKQSSIKIALLVLATIAVQIVNAQTFWGTHPGNHRWGGGTIFSFDAQTSTYQEEYVFKPNPVFNAISVFEERPNSYIGVCSSSRLNGLGNYSEGNSIYRYDANNDITEVLFTYPKDHYHLTNFGGNAFAGNDMLIGVINLNDSIRISNYSISENTYKEIGYFNSENYPDEGVFTYRTTNYCYFTPVNDTLVIFILEKAVGTPNSTSRVGYDYFAYNPQTDHIGMLFSVPYSASSVPKGPFVQSDNGLLYACASKNIMEVNLADSSYQFLHTFDDYSTVSATCMATDSTLVGMFRSGSYDYLVEYDYKNDSVINDYRMDKTKVNTFVKLQDSLYFSINYYQIMAYKPGGDAPSISYKFDNPSPGYIDYLVSISDTTSILCFGCDLSIYYPEKKAYLNKASFGATSGGRSAYKYGSQPTSDLLLASNDKLYGLTANGGLGHSEYGDGVLFQMDPATKVFQKLVDFKGENGGFGDRHGFERDKCQNTLLEVNQKIYGTTYCNGAYTHSPPGYGTIFTYDISRNYNNFKKIYDFNDSYNANTGRFPMSGLIQGANGKLYGTCLQGGKDGIYGHGVLYEIDPNQNDTFRLVLQIPDTALYPVDNLVLADNSKLYGLASNAEFNPTHVEWAIREYDVENGTFTDLYTSPSDVQEYNYSQFVYHNNKLYGVVKNSGNADSGYLYEFDLATKQLVVKVSFNTDGNNAKGPKGNLMLSSTGTLWGISLGGGANSVGTIYEYNPADATFNVKYDFEHNNASADPVYASLVETAGVYDTGVRKNSAESSIENCKVFPNPTSDFVRFKFVDKDVQAINYQIFDTNGKLLGSQAIYVSENLVIDISGFEKGTYIIKLETQNQSFSKTVIRQ